MEEHRQIRLVAVDLDGTLLNDAKKVTQQTAGALACLSGRGVRVVIASARPPRSVRHIYRQLALQTWQINYNGALIWDESRQQVIEHRPLAGPLVREMIDCARAMDREVLVTCEVLDRWYTDRFEQAYTTETGRLFRPDVIAPLETFCGAAGQEITKLLLLGRPPVMARIEPVLQQRYGRDVVMVRTEQELIQVMHRTVSKAAALQRVAGHYDVPMENVLAIGDAPNDVGMLQVAGVGVAMDNAHPAVKRVADWVAPSNNDHGVHAALQRYGLCG